MGGMLKTRNAIEAAILGTVVGWPVLHLSFSLQTRIIILCLTALPLVLFALIGVSGESLSSFFLLLLSWLRNRRQLKSDGTTDGKRKKSMLPSWSKGEKVKLPDETPKSRRRVQIDVKKRQMEQHKTFLPKEDTVRPLNALADYVPIERIRNGVIYTRDHRYVKIVEVIPVNFLLRSAQEQRSIIYSFISYLKIAPVKIQLKVLTKRADID
ncbi:MAG: PrgI family protein, partial [Oscillospiraceae bacterium]|nr:PrgI family protein [Oscillospiraceae bacterium]